MNTETPETTDTTASGSSPISVPPVIDGGDMQRPRHGLISPESTSDGGGSVLPFPQAIEQEFDSSREG